MDGDGGGRTAIGVRRPGLAAVAGLVLVAGGTAYALRRRSANRG